MNKIITSLFLFFATTALHAANFPDISVEDLQKAVLSKKVAVIDVNGPKSFAKGHIPGAIEFSKQKKNLQSLLPRKKDTLVVAYCGGPSCRAYLRGAKAAAELGYTNVRHLSAGISGWKKAGQKVDQK
ncbi:MAG TPA: sulfurtransferase [Opitutae bacterium]|nr:sulfurtransferase [Opitutae bacterium]|tara:strand:+ start:4070 stop:4453 length:384 start_codon:yes stop_codon:yes gene_type:complete